MNRDKIKVLYVCGAGRSGSTILDRILGQVKGFFSAGEVRVLWDRVLAEHLLCGCEIPLAKCPVWSSIIQEAFGEAGMDRRAAHRIRHLTRFMATPLILVPGARKVLSAMLAPHLESLAALYRGISSTTGCRVIIDSSKASIYGSILAQVPTIELHLVHLIRDPRAVAYSWQKRKSRPDMRRQEDNGLRYMSRFGPVTSSLMWGAENLASEILRQSGPIPYLRVRYEDFMARPQETVRQITSMLGLGPGSSPFLSDTEVNLGVNHTVAGNPDRVKTGVIQLRTDDEWRVSLAPVSKRAVEFLTRPMLRRYGYAPASAL